MDEEEDLKQKFLIEQISYIFKSAIAVLATLISAAIIGIWSLINNLNIEQVKQSGKIDELKVDLDRSKNSINDVKAGIDTNRRLIESQMPNSDDSSKPKK